ncbi:hypothetical protein MUN81_14930 [Hymenobacter sp. 5317J-9]|uniref:hypothetical protein n=1 Tax=Hymenobacter sp. 5317J-9 TaxID=2932250 RepID=UPI001FD6F2F2|nr:hypothetical protein [Hymenobacter sp. 5317J-9]UOQ96531.1 hypothetical protein MUN81_14930 [Hymenobacter sp. 5317J-9]
MLKTPFPALALLGSALLVAACHRDTPTPEPDPCLGLKANPLAFRFLENYGTPTPDTAFTKQTISFEAPGAPYTSYEWRVGTDPRVFTTRKFGLFFPEAATGTYAVRLIATRPPNTRCFAKDDGVDTLTQVLTLVNRTQRRAVIYGKFLGSNTDAPRDTFTIRVFQAPDFHQPNDPLAAPYDYLRNLGRSCQSPYFGIGLTWRGINFNYGGNDFNCLTETGTGYLTTRDSIRVDYSQFESDQSLKRVSRVFKGRRVR